jgi:hypothetical protein
MPVVWISAPHVQSETEPFHGGTDPQGLLERAPRTNGGRAADALLQSVGRGMQVDSRVRSAHRCPS